MPQYIVPLYLRSHYIWCIYILHSQKICIIFAKGSTPSAIIGSGQAFGGIFNECCAVSSTNGSDLIKSGRCTVKIFPDDNFAIRILSKRFIQYTGVHVPHLVLGVNKDLIPAFVESRAHCR